MRDEDGWEEWRAEGRTWRVAPDGTLAATAHGETVRAFVEIDLGTMTQRRLRDKMLRYLRYAHDERWRDRHPHCPAVLVVTTSEERAERFLAGVEILRRRQRRRSTIWWAASDTADTLAVAACGLVADPDTAVTAPVWRHAATDALSALADVLSAHAATCAQREADEAAQRARAAQREYDKEQRANVNALRFGGHRALDGLGDQRLGEALDHLLARDGVADDPLARAVGQWWDASRYGKTDPGRLPNEALAGLLALHREVWSEQANLVGSLARAAPDTTCGPLVVAARRLGEGRILYVGDTDQLQAGGVFDQQEVLAGYHTRRARAVAAERRDLHVWQRVGAEPALSAAYDDEHLWACNTCGTAVPDSRHPEYGRRGCPACRATMCVGPNARASPRSPILSDGLT